EGGQAMKILIIDNSESQRNTIKETIERRAKDIGDGLVLECPNGTQALEKLDSLKKFQSEHYFACLPDLILCNCEMPDMDGWEFTKRVRTTSAFNHIPIIVGNIQTRKLAALKALEESIGDFDTDSPIEIPEEKQYEIKPLLNARRPGSFFHGIVRAREATC
ncbi:PleD family two-component system response regulator, partial [Candidatus Riflebacteria bacterium]